MILEFEMLAMFYDTVDAMLYSIIKCSNSVKNKIILDFNANPPCFNYYIRFFLFSRFQDVEEVETYK